MGHGLWIKSLKNQRKVKKTRRCEDEKSRLHVLCLLVTFYLSLVTLVYSEMIERIVAIVNDNVILLSDYEEALQAVKSSDEKLTDDMVLNAMIDRVLILEQARKMRLVIMEDPAEAVDDDRIINEYIERRIKLFVHIPIEEIESYFNDNREQFSGKEFYEVKDEIEEHLAHGEIKIKLAEHVGELRKKAYIRIQKDPVGPRK